MNAHPLTNAFPLMQGAKFDQLVESIRKVGLLHPIVRKDGLIIDGRNRVNACRKAKVTPRFQEYDRPLPVEDYIWATNVGRRPIDEDQRTALVMSWEEYERGQAKKRQSEAGKRYGRRKQLVSNPPQAIRKLKTRQALARRAGVTDHKIRQSQRIKRYDERKGTDLLRQVERGEKTLRKADNEIAGRTRRKVVRKYGAGWSLKGELSKVRIFLEGKVSGCPASHRKRFRASMKEIAESL